MIRRLVPVLVLFFALGVTITPFLVDAETLEELQEQLKERQRSLQNAEKRIEAYKKEILEKKKEARSLEDQIDIIDGSVDELVLGIERTIAELAKTSAEIATVEKEIEETEADIKRQKRLLSEYLRSMHELDQQSTVTVFLKYNSFSDVIQEASTWETLQSRGKAALDVVQDLRDELDKKRDDLAAFQQTLDDLRARQERQKHTLQAQRDSKERILGLTREQESQFKDLLIQYQSEHKAAEAEIKRIDHLIREELAKQGRGDLPSVGVMTWPIPLTFGISCEFHCGGYPYEYLIGPHSGIDIPASPGTPIAAPAGGHVARAHDSGGSGYSYILLLHGDNVSTVFGHVSGFAVSEGEDVERGQTIGYTGGAPGSRGAGLSSGPHLHFEVRENDVAVNPRKYLE